MALIPHNIVLPVCPLFSPKKWTIVKDACNPEYRGYINFPLLDAWVANIAKAIPPNAVAAIAPHFSGGFLSNQSVTLGIVNSSKSPLILL
jgi:hypothetical protein